MIFPALITILALILYTVFIINVGRARARYGIKAPAVTGNEDFERYYRVQLNTLEQLIIFIPSLWIFGLVWNAPNVAAGIGAVWLLGRILYAAGYYKAASKRGPGFGLTILSALVLMLGSLVGICWQLLKLYHINIPYIN